MGSVWLRLPKNLTEEQRACLPTVTLAVGYDQSPVPTKKTLVGDLLKISKDSSESGLLISAWIYESFKEISVSTTLRERDEPYDFLLELARGKLNRLRKHVSDWQAIGLTIKPELREQITLATRLFGQAVHQQQEESNAELATASILQANSASLKLASSFAEQLMETRMNSDGPLETKLGIKLDRLPAQTDSKSLKKQINSVKLIPSWHQIQKDQTTYHWAEFDRLVDWALAEHYHVTIGPLIDLTETLLPGHLANQPENCNQHDIAKGMEEFIRAIVSRYNNRVRSWHIASGFNYTNKYGWDEDDRLRLVARLYSVAQEVDADLSLIVGVALPWGEYLTTEDYTYSPLVFADTLIRAGFSFSAVELEIYIGESARSSDFRDPLLLYQLIELFGLLSIPIEVCFGERSRNSRQPPATELIVHAALAVSLPHCSGVYWDLPTETHLRDGSNLIGSLTQFLHKLQKQYCAEV